MSESTFQWRWSHVDVSGATTAYVDVLNQIRPDDDPAHFPQTMAQINAQPGERILEVGCGNGAVACAVAQHRPDILRLVAVDASTAMIAQARLQPRDLPLSFLVADAHHFPFEDASFDRCHVQELFVILPDPHQVLGELMRVTCPGGHLCLWEADLEAHALIGSDMGLIRRLLRFVSETEYNGAVACQLIEWLQAKGWQVQVVPTVSVTEDAAFLLTTLLPEWLADACRRGVFAADEAPNFSMTRMSDGSTDSSSRIPSPCVSSQSNP